MEIILLVAVIVLMTVQSMAKKAFTIKFPDTNAFFYTCLSCVVAAVFFALTAEDKLVFSAELIPYAAGFAISSGSSMFFSILALKYVSMALTSLVVSYSLIIPALFGIIMYKEPVSPALIIGIVLLCISLALIKSKEEDKVQVTFKWIVCAFLSFLGNGFCSSVQQIQQKTFDGGYKSEFMIMSLAIVVVITLALSLIYERKHISVILKKGILTPIINGAANGGVNLFVMYLVLLMPSSVLFPVVSEGGIVMTAVVSMTIYKERLSKKQIASMVLGIFAIVFLNL